MSVRLAAFEADSDALADIADDGELLGDEEAERPAQVRRRSLREHLTEEVNQARDNLTRYIFQTVSIGAIGAGTIVHYMAGQPYLGTAAALLLPIILITSKLATTNYEVMHRNLGYLLHLERTRAVPTVWRGRWRPEYRHIGWEEAMRAWRVVQPTLFNKVMRPENLWRPWRYQRGFEPHRDLSRGRSQWFAQRSMIGADRTAHWRPGGSLKVMQYILTSMAIATLLIMAMAPVRYLIAPNINPAAPSEMSNLAALGTTLLHPGADWPARLAQRVGPAWSDLTSWNWHVGLVSGWRTLRAPATFAAAMAAAFVTTRRLRIDRQRRKVLEDGLLSIHACAILWQAVAVAHFAAVTNARLWGLDNAELIARIDRGGKALRAADAVGRAAERLGMPPTVPPVPDGAGLPGYTFWLAQEARSLAARADDIHGWIGQRDRQAGEN